MAGCYAEHSDFHCTGPPDAVMMNPRPCQTHKNKGASRMAVASSACTGLHGRPLRRRVVYRHHMHLRLGGGDGARQSDLVVEVRHVVVLMGGDLSCQRLRKAAVRLTGC